MSLQKACDKLNTDPRNEKARAVLQAFCGPLACLPPQGPLEAGPIEECRKFLTMLQQDRAPAGVYKHWRTFAEWAGENAALRADPSVGLLDGRAAVPLDPHGEAMDGSLVNWGKVPRDRQVLVLHGRRTNMLAQHPDPETRARWAGELERGVTGRWLTIQQDFAKLPASQREAVEAMLVCRPFVEASPRPPVPPPRPPAPGRAIPPVSSDAVRLLLISHPEDARMAEELVIHLHAMRAAGLVSIERSGQVEPGCDRWVDRDRKIASAELVLPLVTARLLAWEEYDTWIGAAQGAGKYLVPIILEACDWSLSSMGVLGAIPPRPVSEWGGGRNQAWVEIAGAIRSLLRIIPRPVPIEMAELRRMLNAECPTDADLVALCTDHFPDILGRFTGGMDLLAKKNLVLTLADRRKLAYLLSPVKGGL